MLKRFTISPALLLAGSLLAGSAALTAQATQAADAVDTAALAAEGKQAMMAFGTQLKGELQAAMKAGGPVNAIGVCNDRAVPIAEGVSAETGWTLGRTSHKLRNPNNAPDAFEQSVLEDFLARQAQGESAAEMVHTAIVDTPDDRRFRMVKAIPTAEACLTCHGTEIAPEVTEKLDALYPADAARGFREGEMRGVFTLEKPL